MAGYFLDEVLYRQPPEVVDFMLATSVLDELSVDATTALCGHRSGDLLEHLYRSHLFVTVVDERARTFPLSPSRPGRAQGGATHS